MRIAFFDAKPYDKPSFDAYGKEHGVTFKYFETKLNEDTAELAKGYDGVCVFVNDIVNAAVVDRLQALGVKTVAPQNIAETTVQNLVDLKEKSSARTNCAGAAAIRSCAVQANVFNGYNLYMVSQKVRII